MARQPSDPAVTTGRPCRALRQVHSAVVAAGEKQSGCTVHYVEEVVDAGEIAVQKKCAVLSDDTAESLKARVQALEGPALCEAIVATASEVRSMDPVSPASAASPASSAAPLSYKTAGVSIDEGNALVEAIKPLAKSTARPGLMVSSCPRPNPPPPPHPPPPGARKA